MCSFIYTDNVVLCGPVTVYTFANHNRNNILCKGIKMITRFIVFAFVW